VFCVLAESHRAPFDFSEAESELVSGYNTEYAGGFFAFTFLREYGILLVRSNLIVFIFLGSFFDLVFWEVLPLVVAVLALIVSFTFI
jgi:NADH-ubiquinone oxidoreductase chain 1